MIWNDPEIENKKGGIITNMNEISIDLKQTIHNNLRETLNPNASGKSLNSKFNNVLLPEPEGPLNTTGRRDMIQIPPNLIENVTNANKIQQFWLLSNILN